MNAVAHAQLTFQILKEPSVSFAATYADSFGNIENNPLPH